MRYDKRNRCTCVVEFIYLLTLIHLFKMDELKIVLEKIQGIKEKVDEAGKKSVSKEEFEARVSKYADDLTEMKELLGEKDSAYKKLEEAMKEQGLELTRLKAINQKKSDKTVDQQLRDIFSDNKEFERIRKMKNGSFEFDIHLKDAADMNRGAITDSGGGSDPVSMLTLEPGREGAPKRNPFVLELIQTGTTGKSKITWVERQPAEGGPKMTPEYDPDEAEGASKYGQTSWKWVEKDTTVKKVTVYTKVTNEMLEDVDALISEIRTEMLGDMRLKVDEQLLKGDGAGNNLSGLLRKNAQQDYVHVSQWDNELAAGYTYTDERENPYIYDVLRVGITQILVHNFRPNYIVLNPIDAMALELTKDENGVYLMPPFFTREGMLVSGARIVENTGITAGSFLIGDFTRAKAFFRRQLNFNIYDQNEDDALYDRRTMTATVRLAFRVKEVHRNAFVAGSISDGLAALTPPVEQG